MAYTDATFGLVERLESKRNAVLINRHTKSLITQRDANAVTLQSNEAMIAHRKAYYQNLINLGIGNIADHNAALLDDPRLLSEGSINLNAEQARLNAKINSNITKITNIKANAISDLSINQAEQDEYQAEIDALNILKG